MLFSRDTKLFITFDSRNYEIPILDGYSFSQSANPTEIALSEASTSAGVTRRGRKIFNNSYAPAEFSFQTHMRPFAKAGGTVGTSGSAGGNAGHGWAPESLLWALFTSRAVNHDSANDRYDDGVANTVTTANDGTMNVPFTYSNRALLGEATYTFVVNEATTTGGINYQITNGVLNEASIDFDLEGLATISWSGMGSTLTETATVDPLDRTDNNCVYEGVDATNNFIANKLTTVILDPTDSQTGLQNPAYTIALTGGNITFSNNISFLTPEELSVINTPFRHVTGARSISGSLTCYLDEAGAHSADLFQDLSEATSLLTNEFALTVNVGGTTAPKAAFSLPRAHLGVPTHSIEDIISLEITFDALPSDFDSANEATITYTGVAAV